MLMLLTRWLRCSLPPEFADRAFPFTSIAVSHAAHVHKIKLGGMFVPKVILGVGNYSGGQVRHWPGTERNHNPYALVEEDSTLINIHERPAKILNACCWGKVEPFDGERFSVAFYTPWAYGPLATISALKKAQLKKCGFEIPDWTSFSSLLDYMARTQR